MKKSACGLRGQKDLSNEGCKDLAQDKFKLAYLQVAIL